MNIVMVGCGQQGRMHLRCLSRLKNTHDIKLVAVVDRDAHRAGAFLDSLPRLGLDDTGVLIGDDLSKLAASLDLSDTVVDVVTTNSAHHEVAQSAAAEGVRGILIEKPIADTPDHARSISELDRPVYVLENYVFSIITRFARDFLQKHKLKPCFAKTEFSKDRRRESADGRGILPGYTPHVFDVEMPHQIAVASYLLGAHESIYDAWCNDMILADGRIADHGEGAITMDHGSGVTSYNFSCLQGHHHLATTYRTARIYCEDRTKLFCYYPCTLDLTGSVRVYRGEALVEQHSFRDDSLTETLRCTLECCNNLAVPFNDARFGCSLLDVLNTAKHLAKDYR